MTRIAIAGAAGRMGKNLVIACSEAGDTNLTQALEQDQSPSLGMDCGLLAGLDANEVLITSELDAGPIIVQARVPVRPTDDPDTLAARVLEQEHRIFPQAIRWFAEDRLEVCGNTVLLDGAPVET